MNVETASDSKTDYALQFAFLLFLHKMRDFGKCKNNAKLSKVLTI